MAKTEAGGKKVIIRRLPPGMTADEFWNILGDEWKVGNGKVDWERYDNGEISNEWVFLGHNILTKPH
jgi:regulator of nonsense transcripts 3